MPGAGKTYWGAHLAEKLGLLFVDLDQEIVKSTGMEIPELFATYGEQGFRTMERHTLLRLADATPEGGLVATGGGTACHQDNMQFMLGAGTVIYLKASIVELLQRLEGTGNSRPLLKGKENLEAYLTETLAERKTYYEQAHYILQTANITLSTFDQIFE